MRLCWNDAFGGVLGNIKPEDAAYYYNLGLRVVGLNVDITDVTTADIDRAKHILEDHGLMPGPLGGGATLVHRDTTEWEENKKRIIIALKVAGRLGCTAVRTSIGSMHPTDKWMHHRENFTQRAIDTLVKNARELAPIAEDAGCMICPETTQWTIVHDIRTMKEFVDRCDSPYVRIVFDFVNHMNPERAYNSGEFIKCTVAQLGNRIGEFHVKDVKVEDKELVIHIDETPMGTGLLDHETLIRISNELEPWKTFSLEHINSRPLLERAVVHIQGIAQRINHRWTEPRITRSVFESR